jgi:hypothetical protein
MVYYQLHPPEPHFGVWSNVHVGPFDAVVDSRTGHLIVAMGHDGVLVRTSNGEWHWTSVGPYSLRVITRDEVLELLVQEELIVALLLVVLSLPTLIHPVRNDAKCLETSLLAFAWVVWGSAAVIFMPWSRSVGSYLNFGGLGLSISLLISGLIAGSFSLVDFFSVYEEKRRALLPICTIAFIVGALFFLPYILWADGTLPRHGTAMLFALILTICSVVAGQQYMKRLFHDKPLTRKRKKVDDADNLQRVENSVGGDE